MVKKFRLFTGWAASVLAGLSGVALLVDVARYVLSDATKSSVAHSMFIGAALLAVTGALVGAALMRRSRSRRLSPDLLDEVALAQVADRERLASRLHGTAIQSLVVAAYLTDRDDGIALDTDALREQVLTAEREVRDIILDTRFPNLVSVGLSGACTQLAELVMAREGVRVDWWWAADADTRLSEAAATTAYRFLHEVINNAAQHSGADRVEACVVLDEGNLHLSVTDRGRGFDSTAALETGALAILASTARLIGAEMKVGSELGRGTTVSLSMPLDRSPSRAVVPMGYIAHPCHFPSPAVAPTARTEAVVSSWRAAVA